MGGPGSGRKKGSGGKTRLDVKKGSVYDRKMGTTRVGTGNVKISKMKKNKMASQSKKVWNKRTKGTANKNPIFGS